MSLVWGVILIIYGSNKGWDSIRVLDLWLLLVFILQDWWDTNLKSKIKERAKYGKN